MTMVRVGVTSKSERTRARITQAAIAEFASSGIRSARISAVAKAAEVSPASVFGYFGSKEQLFFAAFEADATALITEIAAGLRFRATGGVVHGRWSDVWSLFETAVERHPLVDRLLTVPELPTFASVAEAPAIQELISTLAREIGAGQSAGTVRADVDAHAASEGLVNAIVAVIVTYRQLGLASHPARLKAILDLFDVALNVTLPAADDTQPLQHAIAVGDVPSPNATGAEPLLKGARTRERILDVAIETFGATGFASGRVSQIASETGITAAAVFAHFKSKDELSAQALERDVGAMVASAMSTAEASETAVSWAGFVDAVWSCLGSHPLAARVISAKDPIRMPQLRDFFTDHAALVWTSSPTRTADSVVHGSDDGALELMVQGLVDLACCLIVAQAQSGSLDEPTGWDARLGVLSMFAS